MASSFGAKTREHITSKLISHFVSDERYNQGHGPRIYQLKGELYEFRQGSLSVTDYYAKLKGIWDQLDQFTKTNTCACGSKCSTLINMQEERDNEKVYKFLMGLDDRYGTVRSNIISTEPLPSLTHCFAMISREELQLKAGQREDPRIQAAAFISKGKFDQKNHVGEGRTPADGIVTCEYCQRPGHDKSRCFEIIGYPEHWKNRGGGRAGRGRGRGGGNRGGRGARANAVQAQASTVTGEVEIPSNTVQMPSLTQAQLDRLMSLLGTNDQGNMIHDALSGKKFSLVHLSDWIIDSGASHHVSSKLEILENLREAEKDERVIIPNGNSLKKTSDLNVKENLLDI
ncbi:hypothetical protein DH2020_027843 [Rehmannia glutinosa]|uniref:Retrotransposon gag domain-containing protein n=1 Tax=Rehmannia glutinosa TaxID=99300 RepID=A0ABR0VTZ0_REHGL